MKEELPDSLKLNKGDEKRINKFLKVARGWAILGLIHGAIIIGTLLLFLFLK